MTFDKNPFPEGDADRHALWEMLVRRDIDAFIGQDWTMVEDDFIADSFFGMHAHFLSDADAWRLQFPSLGVYRDEWLRQAKETAATKFAEPLREALFRVTNMRDIDVDGDRATGRWRILMPCTIMDGDEKASRWLLGDYEEEYVRRNGAWLFKKIDYLMNFNVAFDQSWADSAVVRAR